MNLYQYLPPHSSHPPSALKGMIYSLMRTYFKQNTRREDYISTVAFMFHHLLARGWDKLTLKETIIAADTKLHLQHCQEANPPMNQPENQPTTTHAVERESLFFHLPYHPNDIPRRRIQQLYNYYCRDVFSTTLDIERFTVAYSRHKNLKEHLTQARLHQAADKKASSHPLCPAIPNTLLHDLE